MANTYREILDRFSSIFNNQLTKEMFESVESKDPDTNQIIITYANPVKPRMSFWISEISATKAAIFAYMDFLFNDYDDEGRLLANMNFNTINGYADGSKAFEFYNETTQEFSEMPEYFWARGELYDMLSNIEIAEYLNKFSAEVAEIADICEEWQQKYNDHPEPPSSTGDDGSVTTIEKVEYFWGSSSSDNVISFKAEIDSKINFITSIKEKFIEAKANVAGYMDLFYDATDAIGRTDQFIAALNKTVNGPGTRLSDSFAKFGKVGFASYSPSMGAAYQLFLNATVIRDNSKWAAEDEYDMYLRKIAQSMALEGIDYFDTAKNYLEEFKQFRKELNV